MTDDKPIPANPYAQIWSQNGLGYLRPEEVRKMTEFVHESAGRALALDPKTDLFKLSRSDLLALAVRAQQDGLEENVVGTILVIAAGRGSTLALGALAQILGQRLDEAGRIGGDFAGRRDLRRTLRAVEEKLSARALLDKFDDFKKEFDAADEAVTLARTWQEFRKAGVTGATHRVLAPNLKSLRHIEGGGSEFRVLTGPLPLWRSRVAASVLATVLAAEFPHLSEFSSDIATFVAGGAAASARPLLLVGPPGIGKDSILRRAAELVSRPTGEYDLAGTSDNRILKGTSKGWSTACPGHAVEICVRHRCANPLLQYSELDRAGGGRRNGQVNEALLGLCEPESRKKWLDDGLGTEVDLRDVAVAFTANGTEDTPPALLSRLRVLRLERPKAEHVADVLVQARRRLAAERQVPIDDLPEPELVVIGRLERVARQGGFNLRIADRIVRALSELRTGRRLN